MVVVKARKIVLLLGAMAALSAAACEHRLGDLRASGVEVSPPITAEQVERLNMVLVQEGGKMRIVPFGDSHGKWVAFKASLRMTDRFVALRASAELAARLGIRIDGHTIVRGTCVVGFIKGATS